MILRLLAVLFFGPVSWLLYKYVIPALRSPLRKLPGPPSRGIFASHLRFVMDPHYSPRAHEIWTNAFGNNIVIKGFTWFDNRLLTLDPRTISYVLGHPADYEKPWQSRRLIGSLIGEGLLAAEGAHHRRQRKVMNPAFSANNIRALTPIFFRKAYELRNKWLSLTPDRAVGERFSVSHWLSRATFDVIGIAGFGYEFNAIEEENEKVYLAYKDMFEVGVNKGQTLKAIAILYFPWIAKIFPDDITRITEKSQETIRIAGHALVEKKKREFAEGNDTETDLLSLLVRSNMSSDIDPSQRISDQDISNQINTFLFAGSDTTSLSIAWCLYVLAQNSNIQMQTRLREELVDLAASFGSTSTSGTSPEDDERYANPEFFTALDKLPYLDKICREILRFIPPVHSSIRVAMKDDILPVSPPEKPGMDMSALKDGIRIKEGEFIHVAIEGFNLAKSVWGEDAHEFNPDRWDDLPEAVRAQPGLYSNVMTFGAGPRSCIGLKFSMTEMKTFLFVLIRAFSFSEPAEIYKVNVILTRPFVKRQYTAGSQLPMLVTPIP